MKCPSAEIALKGLFLGPQAENRDWVAEQIAILLESWFDWRRNYFPKDGCAISAEDMHSSSYCERREITEKVLRDLAARFEAEIPKFSPRYIGHMFSEISLPALFGHILTLLHNPNNISGESSKVGVFIEEEAIQALLAMGGFATGAGHFTSGGTVANYEAMYRARARCWSWMSSGLASGERSAFTTALRGWRQHDTLPPHLHEAAKELHSLEGNPILAVQKISQQTGQIFLGPVVLVPEHKHYSWVKAANVFGLGADAFWPVRLDGQGRMDVEDLKNQILRAENEDRPILMIVSVLGTTELGMIDPIHDIQDLLDTYREKNGWHFWHHVDAAYGGFLCSLPGPDHNVSQVLSPQSQLAVAAVPRVSSLTIDPHKLGYVPYSSGAFLAADPRDYFQNSFGAPYVDFKTQQENPDKGPFTLEGSRSAAGAVATWMTARCIGLSQEGYGKIIARTIQLKSEFEVSLVRNIKNLRAAPAPDSNLIGFCVALPGESLRETNARTLQIVSAFQQTQDEVFYISKTKLHRKNYDTYIQNFVRSWDGRLDDDELVLIRLCIMNPFFKSKEMSSDFQKLFIESLRRITAEL